MIHLMSLYMLTKLLTFEIKFGVSLCLIIKLKNIYLKIFLQIFNKNVNFIKNIIISCIQRLN